MQAGDDAEEDNPWPSEPIDLPTPPARPEEQGPVVDSARSEGSCRCRLTMNREVFITCAVTGSGGTQDRSPHVPRSPKQIADSAIDAAKAGAAIVHCHVRDPETGKPRRDVALYREVTERIRDADVDVVLNLTAGMGGDMVFGDAKARCR